MSEMIDRVAMAICIAHERDDRSGGRDQARAVIEAMRKPTEAMIDEWAKKEDRTFIKEGSGFLVPERAWSIGIMEALK